MADRVALPLPDRPWLAYMGQSLAAPSALRRLANESFMITSQRSVQHAVQLAGAFRALNSCKILIKLVLMSLARLRLCRMFGPVYRQTMPGMLR